MSTQYQSALARQWLNGDVPELPHRFGSALAIPATVTSGRAVAFRRGVAHHSDEAVLVYDDEADPILAVTWLCGLGSVRATPVERHGSQPVCHRCAEAARYSKGPAVYRLYDDEDALLYVGSTATSVFQRIEYHRNRADWWADGARVEVDYLDSERDARLTEGRAISAEQPLYNVVGMDARPAEGGAS